jgi:hypothetical protein
MKLLAALVTMSSLLTGCMLQCGFDGEGDRTFRRGSESMIFCTNGGFALVLEDKIVEGRYTFDGLATVGTDGATGTHAFTLTEGADGTAMAPELGTLAWEATTLDKTDLDHAHLQCEDLEARPWWTTP